MSWTVPCCSVQQSFMVLSGRGNSWKNSTSGWETLVYHSNILARLARNAVFDIGLRVRPMSAVLPPGAYGCTSLDLMWGGRLLPVFQSFSPTDILLSHSESLQELWSRFEAGRLHPHFDERFLRVFCRSLTNSFMTPPLRCARLRTRNSRG